MADISGFGFLRHLRAEASSYVLLFQGSTVKRSGRGLAFWFSPYATSLAEVPCDDREVEIVFHVRSADFQDVVVQGSVTYRVFDPVRTATRVDFAIDPRRGTYLRQPLEKLTSTLTQLAQQPVQAYVQGLPLRETVARGHEGIRGAIEAGLAQAPLLAELGLVVALVRIASVKPAAEVERALEAPARERIQEEADEASFRRRAQAVDKERAIAENELANQIELARREQQLIEQRGRNAQREAAEKAEAARIEAEARAQRMRVDTEAQAGGIRAVEGARNVVERERLDAYRDMPPAVLAARAAQELAGKLQKIEHLNITPDLLGPLLQRLVDAGARRLEQPQAAQAAQPARPERPPRPERGP